MSVFKAGFSIDIVADKLTPITNSQGELLHALADRSVFRILLGNQTTNHCNTVVYYNGNRIGAFHINPMSTLTIDRSVYNVNKFVFKKEEEYNKNKNNKNGLIEVFFIPEKMTKTTWKQPDFDCICKNNKCNKKFNNNNNNNNNEHNLVTHKSYNIESYTKHKFVETGIIHNNITDKNLDKRAHLVIKLINDSTSYKPFVKNIDKNIREFKHIKNMEDVPPNRHYEDFFLINRYLPYH